MSLAADLLARLGSLLRRGREDDETAEELRFHLEMEAEKNLRAGMDPGEARRQAHLRLGGVDAIREAVRDARGMRPLEDLARDLRYALRGARRSPGFTLVVVLTLTLGIGANTAVFTVVDNFLFRPPPFEHVERLMNALLIWVFASLALALAAIGVHGVTSHLVARRTREFAIRIAMGAHPADLLRSVASETAFVSAAGILLGLTGSLLLARTIAGVLHGVAATDPAVLIGAAGAVFAVALAACCRPARHAMRVDPMRALRTE